MEEYRVLNGVRDKGKMTLLKGSWVGGGRLGGSGGMGEDSGEFDAISRDEHMSSVHSIRSGILPSLGAQSTRHVKLRPFTINPLHRRYRYACMFTNLYALR